MSILLPGKTYRATDEDHKKNLIDKKIHILTQVSNLSRQVLRNVRLVHPCKILELSDVLITINIRYVIHFNVVPTFQVTVL